MANRERVQSVQTSDSNKNNMSMVLVMNNIVGHAPATNESY